MPPDGIVAVDEFPAFPTSFGLFRASCPHHHDRPRGPGRGGRRKCRFCESKCRQSVGLARGLLCLRLRPGRRFAFAAGEKLHVEYSCKYDAAEFQALARRAGFTPSGLWTDRAGNFSVHYLLAPSA